MYSLENKKPYPSVPSQKKLVLINRPRMDTRLS